MRADAVSHQPGSIGDLSTASTPGGNARTRAAYTLAILSLVVVFSLMDRQILSILLEPIKRDLGASDTFMGLLTGFAFVAFFALAGLPIARVADRRSRRLVNQARSICHRLVRCL